MIANLERLAMRKTLKFRSQRANPRTTTRGPALAIVCKARPFGTDHRTGRAIVQYHVDLGVEWASTFDGLAYEDEVDQVIRSQVDLIMLCNGDGSTWTTTRVDIPAGGEAKD